VLVSYGRSAINPGDRRGSAMRRHQCENSIRCPIHAVFSFSVMFAVRIRERIFRPSYQPPSDTIVQSIIVDPGGF
jgi:hypothetical protein